MVDVTEDGSTRRISEIWPSESDIECAASIRGKGVWLKGIHNTSSPCCFSKLSDHGTLSLSRIFGEA